MNNNEYNTDTGLNSSLPFSQSGSDNLFSCGSSPAANMLTEVLITGSKGLPTLTERKKKVNHNIGIDIRSKNSQRVVIMDNDSSQVVLFIPDIDKFGGTNKDAKKMLLWLRIQLCKVMSKGTLTNTNISFAVSDLVESGAYTTYQSALKAYTNGFFKLASVQIGMLDKSAGATSFDDPSAKFVLRPLFLEVGRDKGQCSVTLNPAFDWGTFIQYYTLLPDYCLSLPDNATDLLEYIFYLARQKQNCASIAKNGWFKIKYRAIWERLSLPNEVNNHDPKHTIQDPINKAIADIMAAHKCHFDNDDFQIIPDGGHYSSIGDYLDHGYVIIKMSGSYAKKFIEISKETSKIKATKQRKRDRIHEQAAIKAEQKAIETATKEPHGAA